MIAKWISRLMDELWLTEQRGCWDVFFRAPTADQSGSPPAYGNVAERGQQGVFQGKIRGQWKFGELSRSRFWWHRRRGREDCEENLNTNLPASLVSQSLTARLAVTLLLFPKTFPFYFNQTASHFVLELRDAIWKEVTNQQLGCNLESLRVRLNLGSWWMGSIWRNFYASIWATPLPA